MTMLVNLNKQNNFISEFYIRIIHKNILSLDQGDGDKHRLQKKRAT